MTKLSGGCSTVSPVCLVTSGGPGAAPQHCQHRVTVSGPRLLKVAPLRVVALQHGCILVDEIVQASQPGQPVGSLSFCIPFNCLEVGLVTVHVLAEQQHQEQQCHQPGPPGPAAQELLETSYILALPQDAAKEVLALFDKMMAEIEHFFGRPGADSSQMSLLAPLQKGLSWLLQPRSFSSSSGRATGPHCACCGQARSSSAAAHSPCSSCGCVETQGGRCSTSRQPPVQQQQPRQQPDPVTCYAYEHYFLPFVQHWRGLLGDGGDSSPEADEAQFNQMRRMLDYLMENEMWSCMVLLMGRAPDLWQRVLTEGVESPAEHCLIDSLSLMRRAAPRPSQATQGPQQQQQQQQRRQHGVQVQSLQQQLDRASSASSSTTDSSDADTAVTMQHMPRSPPTHEPAAPVFVLTTEQLPMQGEAQGFGGALQLSPQHSHDKPQHSLHQKLPSWEQQQSYAELTQHQAPQAVTAQQMTMQPQESPGPCAGRQCACGCGGRDLCCDHGPDQLEHCTSSDSEQPGKQRTCCGPAAVSKAAQAELDSSGASDKGKTASAGQQITGSSTAPAGSYKQLERVYVVYKSHSNFSTDVTAAIVSLGFMLAVISQAVAARQVPSVITLLLYSACFYAPYALLLVSPQAYLRHREVLLVSARCSSACVVLAAASGLLPLPTLWRALLGSVLLGVMNGLMLPLCQQLRLWAAVVVAAVQLLCDGLAGAAVGEAPAPAARVALMVAFCTMFVTFVTDVRARRQFMRACNGQGLRASAA